MTTKTEAVRSRVFDAILRGTYAPGDRIPPEREMAETTGTSRVTVRRAYAELEAGGILERRQGSGAYISSAPRAHREDVEEVAVLASLRDPFAIEFIEAMERSLADRGAFMILSLTDQDAVAEARAAMNLVALGVRDIVVWASGGRYDAALFARLRILGTHLVFFDRMIPGAFADYVGLDNAHAVGLLVKRAVDDGATGLVFVSHDGLGADSDRQREEAFTRSCATRGVPGRIVRAACGDRVDAAVAAGVESWFDGVRGTAAVGVNDDVAVAVKRARPRLRVYGIDGLPEAAEAGVVSVAQPMRTMAEAAVSMLVAQHQRGARWCARARLFKGTLSGNE